MGSRTPRSKRHLPLPTASLAEAAVVADVIVNAIVGASALATLASLSPDLFAGRTLLDVANALTPSGALPYPGSSLAERLQALRPAAHVVKSFNTTDMNLVAEPSRVDPSTLFARATCLPPRSR